MLIPFVPETTQFYTPLHFSMPKLAQSRNSLLEDPQVMANLRQNHPHVSSRAYGTLGLTVESRRGKTQDRVIRYKDRVAK